VQTRKQRVDPRVKRADWSTIRRFHPELDVRSLKATAVEEHPTANGPADYASCDGGQIIGVAEAKRVTRSPEGVLTQAERNSASIDFRGLMQDSYSLKSLIDRWR
jgi:type I restriction enzyme R subunit